ncbi:5-carboxymethyl-2-hydroxymuconate delta-isomerase [Mariannaea sp. PMI_226]|nr:5-carboxymethyl-2-hydroxymuconate delta-isomerase [Mariannaea sp. PMI_226]
MSSRLTQYAAYVDPETGLSRIGHFDLDKNTIQPLSFTSGTPISDLYQVIEAGYDKITATGTPFPASSTKLLPAISGRDVLAVGKNYMEHAKEFNSSGFDSSDKVDRPSHPVIFTKRATSIIAHGDAIYPHTEFSETLDYEGEIGVILGKPGFRVEEEDAWDYVWGYTIINDMTARERQRDHKQFFIGKSPDTFCPIGPIAVPKEDLPSTLRIQTHVNGELRQDADTDDLIFSIPTLLNTISAGQTIQPGDVIATGTPAGVGIGRNPPVYLKSDDEIAISVTGLGTLRNKIASKSDFSSPWTKSPFTSINVSKTANGTSSLTKINSKLLHYKMIGSGKEHIVFVHGLGGSLETWIPLISSLSLAESYSIHLFDLEGHGLSPTHPLDEVTLESIAADIRGVFDQAQISEANPATLVAHSMGALAAMRFSLDSPKFVKKLVLIGPPASPLSESAARGFRDQAAVVRSKGLDAVIDDIVASSLSKQSQAKNPLATAALRLSILGQEPESYAKALWALSRATKELNVEELQANTLIIAGDEDVAVSPRALCEKYNERIKTSTLVVLNDVGHWPQFEDLQGLAQGLKGFI